MRTRPPVVLIAGQLLTPETWTAQIAPLSRDYDLRFADHTRDDSISAMAERLLAEAPALFDIVAHAMGGFIAFEVMRRAPGRVRSLALLATLASADGPSQTARRQGYINLVLDGQFPDVVEERIPILLHPNRRQDQDLLVIIRRMALSTGAETFLAQQRAIIGRIDSRPRLNEVQRPTLLVWGRQDGIANQAHQAEMQSAIAGARLAVIEECGHLLTLEQPVQVTRLLKDWLDGQP